MPILSQLALIFGVCLVSEGLAAVIPLPIPASILSMLLLLLLLGLKIVRPDHLQQSGNFLLDQMPLFFIPACVGILRYTDVLFRNVWAILLICLITTPLVFFVTGHVVQLTMKWLKRRQQP